MTMSQLLRRTRKCCIKIMRKLSFNNGEQNAVTLAGSSRSNSTNTSPKQKTTITGTSTRNKVDGFCCDNPKTTTTSPELNDLNMKKKSTTNCHHFNNCNNNNINNNNNSNNSRKSSSPSIRVGRTTPKKNKIKTKNNYYKVTPVISPQNSIHRRNSIQSTVIDELSLNNIDDDDLIDYETILDKQNKNNCKKFKQNKCQCDNDNNNNNKMKNYNKILNITNTMTTTSSSSGVSKNGGASALNEVKKINFNKKLKQKIILKQNYNNFIDYDDDIDNDNNNVKVKNKNGNDNVNNYVIDRIGYYYDDYDDDDDEDDDEDDIDEIIFTENKIYISPNNNNNNNRENDIIFEKVKYNNKNKTTASAPSKNLSPLSGIKGGDRKLSDTFSDNFIFIQATTTGITDYQEKSDLQRPTSNYDNLQAIHCGCDPWLDDSSLLDDKTNNINFLNKNEDNWEWFWKKYKSPNHNLNEDNIMYASMSRQKVEPPQYHHHIYESSNEYVIRRSSSSTLETWIDDEVFDNSFNEELEKRCTELESCNKMR